MSGGRNTTTRDKHRHIIKEGLPPSPFGPRPPCYHCGGEILYEAHHLDPLSFQVDHVTPLNPKDPARAGTDTLDNCVPSHRACNRSKSNRVSGDDAEPAFVTERCWWN